MNEQIKTYEIAVQHTNIGKLYTFITNDNSLKVGDYVVIEEEEKNTSVARIVKAPKETSETEGRKKILRKATEEDIIQHEDFEDNSIKHLEFCKERVRERNLPMKMVGSRFCENGKKLILFFTSEGRVDFRALVKELAQTLKIRIELRQIGSRDGSKFVGCLGPCGRSTCCSTHLRQFQSVSVAMAKNQSLSPNPSKLTGMCNKLKCCLMYENQLYSELRQNMPQVGDKVSTKSGNGYVRDVLIPSKKLYVGMDDGVMKWFLADEVKVVEKAKHNDESSDELKKYESEDEVVSENVATDESKNASDSNVDKEERQSKK